MAITWLLMELAVELGECCACPAAECPAGVGVGPCASPHPGFSQGPQQATHSLGVEALEVVGASLEGSAAWVQLVWPGWAC